MPHLLAPEARHRGRAERTIDRDGHRVIIGCLYDPSRVPPSQMDAELSAELEATLKGASMRPDRRWYPWEAVARLMARYPGDVLPHPGLDVPLRLKAPWWVPSEEEKRQARAKDAQRAMVREVLS